MITFAGQHVPWSARSVMSSKVMFLFHRDISAFIDVRGGGTGGAGGAEVPFSDAEE